MKSLTLVQGFNLQYLGGNFEKDLKRVKVPKGIKYCRLIQHTRRRFIFRHVNVGTG
jgi:hypothetical protein